MSKFTVCFHVKLITRLTVNTVELFVHAHYNEYNNYNIVYFKAVIRVRILIVVERKKSFWQICPTYIKYYLYNIF